MADSQVRYRVNAPNVVSETIDGEVIVINLVSGNYYSLDNVGASIWSWIEQGAAQQEIAEWLPGTYDCDGHNVDASVQTFVSKLQSEGLISPEPANRSVTAAPQPLTDKNSFQTPTLNTFSDMQDLLLLDPIHDVDETGWPRQKPDQQ